MTCAGHVMGMFSGVNTGLGGGRFVVIFDLTHTHLLTHKSQDLFRSSGYLGYGEAEGRRIGILPKEGKRTTPHVYLLISLTL